MKTFALSTMKNTACCKGSQSYRASCAAGKGATFIIRCRGQPKNGVFTRVFRIKTRVFASN